MTSAHLWCPPWMASGPGSRSGGAFWLVDAGHVDLAVKDSEGRGVIELESILLAYYVLVAIDFDRGRGAERNRESDVFLDLEGVANVQDVDHPLHARAIPHQVEIAAATRRHRQACRHIARERNRLVFGERLGIGASDRQLHVLALKQHEDAINIGDFRERPIAGEVGHRQAPETWRFAFAGAVVDRDLVGHTSTVTPRHCLIVRGRQVGNESHTGSMRVVADLQSLVRSSPQMNVLPRTTKTRLPSEVFDLPIDKIRAGYYSDAYFNYTQKVLERDDHRPRVLVQVFQRYSSVLGGVDEAIATLRECAGLMRDDGTWQSGWEHLEVHALYDGDEIEPWESVMTIEGDYAFFCHLETVYLGSLARRSLVATNVREVVQAASPKPIMYFPARHDHYRVQTGDGYAAHVAGAIGVSTDAQAAWWGDRGLGTVPHGLIAAYGGDTVAAAEAFARCTDPEQNLVVLVDFENDCVGTALKVADALGKRLWGVRLDTSGTMVDLSLWDQMGRFDPRGVNPQLVWNVRSALDAAGHENVRIVVSGGFNADKIRAFEAAGVPVDSYGVGSALIRGARDFTADVVMVDGKAGGKRGRDPLPNPRLERVL